MKKVYLVLGAVLLLVPAAARGEISVTASLEWLADHCIDSAIYAVSDVVEEETLNDGYSVTLERKETLRGNPAKTTKVIYCRVSKKKKKDAPPVVEKGDQFLVCFQHYRTGEKRPVQTVNLDKPQEYGFSFIAVSTELKIVKKKADILKIFKSRIKKNPKGDPVLIDDYSKDNRFELEPHAEIFSAIYGGSSCYLRVPKDLVEKVKEQSKLLELEANKTLQRTRKGARR